MRYTIGGLLQVLEGYSGHTWIFFDTETTGLNPRSSQLTEIAAVAASIHEGNVVRPLGTFRNKIKLTEETLRLLNDPTSRERRAWVIDNKEARSPLNTPQEILSMTRYGEKHVTYFEEQHSIDSFYDFVKSYKSPLLVAQNVPFDIGMLHTRSSHSLGQYPTLDTKDIIQHYFLPLLKSRANLHNCEDSISTLRSLERKRRGETYHSSSLGIVAHALGIDNEGWHSALADVEMMINVYIAIVGALMSSKNIDISREHAKPVVLR